MEYETVITRVKDLKPGDKVEIMRIFYGTDGEGWYPYMTVVKSVEEKDGTWCFTDCNGEEWHTARGRDCVDKVID